MKQLLFFIAIISGSIAACAQNKFTYGKIDSRDSSFKYETVLKKLDLAFLMHSSSDSTYIKSKFYNKSAFILSKEDNDSLFIKKKF